MKSFGFADRLKAFSVHLVLSIVVLLPVYGLVLFLWYPGLYAQLQGVLFLLLVLTCVHLVVGPMLTFLVYVKGKKNLRFDLVVIGLLQLVALVYGTRVIYQEKPYFMVFGLDRFNVLAAADVDMDAVSAAGLSAKPWRGPATIMAYMPAGDELQKLQNSVLFEGKPDLERRPEYWASYPDQAWPVRAKAQTLDALFTARPDDQARLDKAVAATGMDRRQLAFVPIMGKKRDFVALVETSHYQLVGIAPVDPWINE